MTPTADLEAPSSAGPTAAPAKVRRGGLFRFGLRTLLVVGLIGSIGLAFGARELSRLRSEAAAVESLRQAGAEIGFDHERTPIFQKPIPHAPPPNPLGLNWIFGEGFFAKAVVVRLSSTDEAKAEHAELLPRLAMLEEASLSDHRFGDESIEPLGQCDRLIELELVRTRVTAEGLGRLANRERIETFRFEEGNPSQVPDALAGVDRLTNLKTLAVEYTYLTKAHCEAISRLEHLESLDLVALKGIEPGALASFSALDTVKRLDVGAFDNFPLTDEDIAAIADMERLEVLYFDGSRVTDEGAKSLGKLRSLRRLSAILPHVTDEGFAPLANVTTLEELYLQRSQMGDASLDAFDRLSNLKTLEVGPTVSRERAIRFADAIPGREVRRFHGPPYIRSELFPRDVPASASPPAQEASGEEFEQRVEAELSS